MRIAITLLTCLCAAVTSLPAQTPARDSLELLRLEETWNRAHLQADTAALSRLWSADFVAVVPEMAPMSKQELLQFWRSGRSVITRYETTGIEIRLHGDAAVVTGRLRRDRRFTSSVVTDDWRFMKVYVRRDGQWQVIAYQASPQPRP